MQKTDHFKTAKKIGARGTLCAMGLGILYLMGSCVMDDAENSNLKDALTLEQDGATYELISPNALYMTIYMVVKDDNGFDEEEYTDAYIFNFGARTVVVGKEPENKDAQSRLVSFDAFNNPAMIENVRQTGCTIAQNIAAYSSASSFAATERNETKIRGRDFAARHCTPVH